MAVVLHYVRYTVPGEEEFETVDEALEFAYAQENLENISVSQIVIDKATVESMISSREAGEDPCTTLG